MPRLKRNVEVPEVIHVGTDVLEVQVDMAPEGIEAFPYQVIARKVEGRLVIDVYSPSGYDRHQMIVEPATTSEMYERGERVRFRTSGQGRLIKRMGSRLSLGRF